MGSVLWFVEEPHKDPEWLREEYVEKEKSMDQIGEELDINSGTVWYYIDKFDIERRDRIEAVKDAVRVNRANYHISDEGYARWTASVGGAKEKTVPVHRLLAVAEYGFDQVAGREVHHKNRIPWDNRPENIVPLSNSEHRQEHGDQYDRWKNRDNPYRDKEVLKEMYIDNKMNQNEIADEFGVAASTIGNWLRKYDIPVRSIGEAKRLEVTKEK